MTVPSVSLISEAVVEGLAVFELLMIESPSVLIHTALHNKVM